MGFPFLKVTAKAPENRPKLQKESMDSKHEFSGTFAVSFRGGENLLLPKEEVRLSHVESLISINSP